MPEDQPQPPARAPTLHIPRRVVPKTGVRPVSDMDAVRDELARFIARHRRIFVLTGAGISTDSGIPDYRDRTGHWKRTSPITHQQFIGDVASRARYWQRSFAGWATIGQAQPNTAHRTLARWQREGRLSGLATQNVDGLHQRAGHRDVVDLHGRIDRVICLVCGRTIARADLQSRLASSHAGWLAHAEAAPDGDAEVEVIDIENYVEPTCDGCGGLLKPDVVFFGGAVPASRVQSSKVALEQADALLVVGSSLMVYSGYRFARFAAEAGKPIALLNRGVTRADDLAMHRWNVDCSVLARVQRAPQ